MHVVLVTREVIPLVEGGGIARYAAEAAQSLAGDGVEVTLITSSRYAERHAELVAAGDPRATPPGVRWAWATEPEGDLTPMWSHHHAWSLACWEAVRRLCEEGGGVDLVEFEDYGGAAVSTIDAKRTGHPALAATTIAVRLHTTWEITQVLDGLPLNAIAARTVMALERHSLAFADRVLAPGERTLEAYRERYEVLAPASVAPMPVTVSPRDDDRAAPPADGTLKLLYVGRLQRLKGVVALVRSVLAQEAGAVTLTLAGGDTDTSPAGDSMRAHLEALVDGDARVRFAGAIRHADLPEMIRAHHLVVVPSTFEAYSYVVREALAENRPVLGSDAGGVADALEVAGTGWAVPAGDPSALAAAIAELAAEPGRVEELITAGAPRRALEVELEPGRFTSAYRELAAPGDAQAADENPLPPCTAVVSVGAGDHDLERTIASLEAAGQPLELIVAAAAPELVPSEQLDRLHGLAVAPGGEPADLRRAGIERATASGPLLLLRAGDTILPAFLQRARRALARDPGLAYVTAHAPGRRPACAPLGNFAARLLPELRVEGTTLLAQPDVALALAVPGDGLPLLTLAERGRYGAVLSEPLVGLARPPAPAVNGRASARAG